MTVVLDMNVHPEEQIVCKHHRPKQLRCSDCSRTCNSFIQILWVLSFWIIQLLRNNIQGFRVRAIKNIMLQEPEISSIEIYVIYK